MLKPFRLSRMVMLMKVKKSTLLIDSLNKTKIKLLKTMTETTEMITMKDQDQDLQVLNQEMATNKVIKIQWVVTRLDDPGNHQMAEVVQETEEEVDSTVVVTEKEAETSETETINVRTEEMSTQTLLLKSTSPKFLDPMVRRT